MQRSLILSLVALLALTACSNSRLGDAAERSLAADPRLETNPNPFGQGPAGSPGIAQLPANYPPQIPLYPNAQLQQVTGDSPDSLIATRWTSPDPAFRLQSFYQQALTERGWEILSRPTDDNQGAFVARLDGLEVTIAINGQPAPDGASPQPTASQLLIQSQPLNAEENAAETGAEASFEVGGTLPDEAVISTNAVTSTASGNDLGAALSPQLFTDLNKVPQTFRPSIQDLAALGVLEIRSPQGKAGTAAGNTTLNPNQITTRREYARWLVLANNRLYGDRPAQQIRLGTEDAQPAFKDVPRSDPDFPYIQGLAEAGIIPSGISGDAAGTLFRPNAPLTRETLLLWKVPLDSRQALPNATVDAIKQTWGFQDAGRIDPRSLRSVLADYQNGDLSNIRRVLGFTTLFQPKRGVTRAEAAATLWYFGSQSEGISARDVLQGSNGSATMP
ncbi:MAG: S-layer homology domain-containing protein [Leptolyngbyaceae cyanobacterium bins.59]|nr:S-layer homology domain-containing protein [Leptolyngbyaceae cyanobacterium bins.59]